MEDNKNQNQTTNSTSNPNSTTKQGATTPSQPQKVSWWNKKTKEEQKSIIKRIIFWTLGIIFIVIILLGSKIFGSNFDMFGKDANGFEAIGDWFKNNWMLFVKTAIIAVVGTMIFSVVNFIIKKLTANSKKGKTIASLFSSFLKYLTIIILLLIILATWGVDVATLIASLGVLTLIIGLGCQSLINDIVSGLFLVIDETFQVGDIVVIDDFRGTVISIGLKQTRIQDAGGNIKSINNSAISTAVNLSESLTVAVCDVGIDYNEDIKRAEAIFAKNMKRIQEDIPAIVEGPFYKGVTEISDCEITFRFVAKCKEEDRYQVVRDLNREFLIIYQENNLQMSYPQIVINQAQTEGWPVSTRDDKKIAAKFVKDETKMGKGIEEEEVNK